MEFIRMVYISVHLFGWLPVVLVVFYDGVPCIYQSASLFCLVNDSSKWSAMYYPGHFLPIIASHDSLHYLLNIIEPSTSLLKCKWLYAWSTDDWVVWVNWILWFVWIASSAILRTFVPVCLKMLSLVRDTITYKPSIYSSPSLSIYEYICTWLYSAPCSHIQPAIGSRCLGQLVWAD